MVLLAITRGKTYGRKPSNEESGIRITVPQLLDQRRRGLSIECITRESLELVAVARDLLRLFLVVVAGQALEVDDVGVGPLGELEQRGRAAEEDVLAGGERQDLDRHIGQRAGVE